MPRVGQVSKVLLQNERKDIGISRRLVALGYARFSDSKKVGGFFTSAEAQEAIIREYARRYMPILENRGRTPIGRDIKRCANG